MFFGRLMQGSGPEGNNVVENSKISTHMGGGGLDWPGVAWALGDGKSPWGTPGEQDGQMFGYSKGQKFSPMFYMKLAGLQWELAEPQRKL